MDLLTFNPPTGFKDSTAYPNPADEDEARAQLMSLHEQTQAFVNTMSNAVTALQMQVVDPADYAALMADITLIKNFIQDMDYAVYLGAEE